MAGDRSARSGSTPAGADPSGPDVTRAATSTPDPPKDAPDWEDLPSDARTAAVSLAARALSTVPVDQVPAMVRPVARFTPAKRARRGALPLTRALSSDDAFRAVIAQHLPPSTVQDSSDLPDAVARSFYLRLPLTPDQRRDLDLAEQVAAQRARIEELSGTVEALTARLADATAAEITARASRNGRADGPGGAQRAGRDGPGGASSGPHGSDVVRRGAGRRPGSDPRTHDPRTHDPRAEVDKLRRRLREQGVRHRRAELAAEAALAEAESAREAARADADRHRAEAERWRERAAQERRDASRAREALDRARHAESQSRADADRRIELLLDAVEGSAAGLRREWRLATTGRDPAEVVVTDREQPDRRHGRDVDGTLLMQWLGLPGAHLIIDGYNVTKTGYPALTLADQRDRLVRSLAPLAARTGAEITVVFDGADVVAPAASSPRVRVVFSPPGVIADDVVRDLAEAEPRGRIVVVVSSDREVVDGVRRSGAWTAPSAVLLEILL